MSLEGMFVLSTTTDVVQHILSLIGLCRSLPDSFKMWTNFLTHIQDIVRKLNKVLQLMDLWIIHSLWLSCRLTWTDESVGDCFQSWASEHVISSAVFTRNVLMMCLNTKADSFLLLFLFKNVSDCSPDKLKAQTYDKEHARNFKDQLTVVDCDVMWSKHTVYSQTKKHMFCSMNPSYVFWCCVAVSCKWIDVRKGLVSLCDSSDVVSSAQAAVLQHHKDVVLFSVGDTHNGGKDAKTFCCPQTDLSRVSQSSTLQN